MDPLTTTALLGTARQGSASASASGGLADSVAAKLEALPLERRVLLGH